MKQESTATRLGGQAVFFLGGNVFTLLVGLPFQIYVARTLGASELGVFSLLEGGVGFMAGLLGFGLAPTLVKFIPYHLERNEYVEIRMLVFWAVKVLLVAGLVAYGSIILLFPLLLSAWPELQPYRFAAYLMGAMIPLGLLMFLCQQGLRGFQEIRYMVIGSSFLQLTAKVLITVSVFALGFKLIGYISAVLLSTAVAIIWMGLGLWRKLWALPITVSSAVNTVPGKTWRRYATVQYSGSVVGLGSVYLDRFLLGFFAGAGHVGVLAVVKQLQQLPAVFLQMFLAVAAPMFSAAHARSDFQEMQYLYNLNTDWILRASLPLFLFFLFYASPLLKLYGLEFAIAGVVPLWILVGSQLVNLAFGPLGTLLNLSGLEAVLLKFTVIQAVITTVGLVVLVPSLGLQGAALSIALGTVFINVGAMCLAKKRLKLTWWDKRYLNWFMPLAACLAFGIASHAWLPEPNAIALAGLLIGLYVVFHSVSIAQGLHEDDKKLLRHLYGKLRHDT